MNSVFEKIIEKLEIERTTANNTFVKYEMNVDLGRVFGLEKAIEIVKQEAEKYNNGWILCSELLPAYGQTVLASVCAEDAEWKIIIACYKEEDFWLDGKIDAWQPLPQPYTKGEHDENTK